MGNKKKTRKTEEEVKKDLVKSMFESNGFDM